MLVAHALMLGRSGSDRRLLLAGVAVTLVLVWLLPRAGYVVDGALAPWLFFQFTLFGCAFAALVGAAAISRSMPVRALLANRPMVFIGTISYSLYLWHYPVLDGLRASPKPMERARRLALGGAGDRGVVSAHPIADRAPLPRHRREKRGPTPRALRPEPDSRSAGGSSAASRAGAGSQRGASGLPGSGA